MYDKLKYTNLSNEFQKHSLDEKLNYDLVLKDLNVLNEVPRAYLNKQRIIKEQSSVGGFRIPEKMLKKRVDPSEYYPLVKDKFSHNTHDKFTFNNNFNSSSNNNQPLWSGGENIMSGINEDEPLSDNLISVFESEVMKLKQEAEAKYSNYNKNTTSIDNNPNNKNNNLMENFNNLNEEKVYNQYLAYNPNRVQAIKHVTTNFKPEYLSLEEIQKQREDHMKILLKTENEFYEKKKKGEQIMNLYGNNKLARNNNLETNENEQHFDIKEIEEALRKEEQEFKNKKLKKIKSGVVKSRARSVNKLRKYNDNDEKPLNKYEAKYIKKFMNYILKKKYLEANDEDFNDKEDWNKTRVRSVNAKAINTNQEDLPGRMDSGHIDKKDYSLYYLSIDSDSPRSLSLKSGSSRAYSGQKLNRKKIKAEQRAETFPVQYGSAHTKFKLGMESNQSNQFAQSKSTLNNVMSTQRNSNNVSDNNFNHESYNSQVSFIRMIFHLLDIDKQGVLEKSKIKTTLNLDSKILEELGFENQEEFLDALLSFPTSNENFINEEEFVGFLLSKSGFNEEFLNNYANQNHNWDNISNDGKKITHSNDNLKNSSNFHNTQSNSLKHDIMNSDEMVNYNSTGQQFFKTNLEKNTNNNLKRENSIENLVSYSKQFNTNRSEVMQGKSNLHTNLNTNFNWNIKMSKYNVSKSALFMMNLKKSIVNEKLKFSYNDYKEFITGFKPRNDLNVTIPNPPSFYDKKGKREKKIKEILDERKEEEDKILGYRFRPNELKREIFISQFENIIVAEKARRMQRCEKLKQRIIQDMRPFSFYEVDEKKYKDKLINECIPPQFLPFKANPIPWTSQVNLYEDMLTKKAVERNQRVEERARQNYLMAKLPPRMEMHDKKKKLQEEELKTMDKVSKTVRSKSFKVSQNIKIYI